MNLGQLLDPAWVQAGCPVRWEPVKPKGIPEQELRVVTTAVPVVEKLRTIGRRTGLTARICSVLAEQTEPMTALDVAQFIPASDARRVANAMNNLLHSHRVKRSGRWGSYSYVITQKGRDFIA